MSLVLLTGICVTGLVNMDGCHWSQSRFLSFVSVCNATYLSLMTFNIVFVVV